MSQQSTKRKVDELDGLIFAASKVMKHDTSLSPRAREILQNNEVAITKDLDVEFTEMCHEKAKKIEDEEERKQFLANCEKNKKWYDTKQCKQVEKIVLTDKVFAALIKVLPLDICVKKRDGSGVCVDDINNRYCYLRTKLRESADQEKHLALLIEQETLRSKVIRDMDGYNKSLRDLQSKMKLGGFESDFERIGYFRLFPEEVDEDITSPLDSIRASCCGEMALYAELAFDIVRFGSLKDVNENVGFYYRVHFSEQ